ncbi:unnamed protein product [Rotaria sordida]|uniref:NAD(P)(+)--arginine ADP-ribosyltransferase n=1 Tax=Rotaria sordida TaxID=392033 RepID=A0A814JRQ0_9BILA|nr:unnamed protein product [Rotaria sordida]CAF3680581.1 unnamed protein product [Rotaria sordida]
MGISNSKTIACEQIQCDPHISLNTLPRHNLSLNEERIEPFNLIWLDEHSQDNSLDSLRTQTLFREMNNDNCLFFDRSDQFLFEIEKLTMEHRKLLVVMSGSFAKEVLSKIHNNISTIVIFCRNYNKYTSLMDKHLNVVEICTEHEKLKSCIQNELLSLKFNLFTNQKFKTIRPLNSSNDIENSGAYFSYILFIELLKQMPQTKQAKNIMLKKCEDYHRRNKAQMKSIELFRNTYTSNKAIDWYTRDSFVYRLVNSAFRTEDVTLWYIFRYYVVDLCIQLENVHKEQNIQNPLTLYRGQAQMPTYELEYLKSNIGCLVSINGFFSSSIDIDIAKNFIAGAVDTDDYKVVIFQITVDGIRLQNTVFVDINRYLNEPTDEQEVLFNIGSVFKIESVKYDSDLGLSIIKMKASDDGTYEIKKRIQLKKRDFRKDNINLMFGRLLIDMNEYSKAESYFQMMLQVLPKSHIDLALVYDHIGDLNMRITNWKEAFTNFNLAYEIKKKILPLNHLIIAITLNNIGNYYKAIGNYVQALEYYTQALQCKNDRFNMARTQLNIGAIYAINNDYENAFSLCIEARDILQQIHPCPYDEIIHCQGIIGDIHLTQQEYNIAADYYLTAFEMSKKFLLTSNRLRVNCIKSLAKLYNKRNAKQLAIDFCRNKLSFYEKYLPENHIIIGHLLMILGEFYEEIDDRKINSLQRALRIFEKNVHLEYATTANCLIMIAEYYQKQNVYERALKYYIRAIEIRKKIYPKDHSILLETESLIDLVTNQT